MTEVHINNVIGKNKDGNTILNHNLKNNIIIGKMFILTIDKQFYNLNLSNLDCHILSFTNQEDLSQYILPKNVKVLVFSGNHLTYLPKLPENIILECYDNDDFEYLEYNPTIKFETLIIFGKMKNYSKIKIKNYDKEIINQEDWDEYMKMIYSRSIKSARK